MPLERPKAFSYNGEYNLQHSKNIYMVEGRFLDEGLLEALGPELHHKNWDVSSVAGHFATLKEPTLRGDKLTNKAQQGPMGPSRVYSGPSEKDWEYRTGGSEGGPVFVGRVNVQLGF